ncbi:MAG: CBS domain-containing protein [Planctomycetes bacterium]|nr:CBS domain-containing protein [Planctomycetota bacterium]
MNNLVELKSGKAKITAEDIISYGVMTVKCDTPIYQAIATLVDKKITGLPVVDENMNIKGIITEKDVLKLLYKTHAGAGIVEEFMTDRVTNFDTHDSLVDICRSLTTNDFRRVTITEKNKLISVISRADLIREQAKKLHQFDMPQRESVSAKQIMKKGLVTVSRNDSIYKAVALLAENRITGLPIVDKNDNLEGIVTEKDILKVVYDPEAKLGPVQEYMTSELVSFKRDDSLYSICKCLIDNTFRRVPILEEGKLVGIISRTDIIDAILRYNASIFRRRETDS